MISSSSTNRPQPDGLSAALQPGQRVRVLTTGRGKPGSYEGRVLLLVEPRTSILPLLSPQHRALVRAARIPETSARPRVVVDCGEAGIRAAMPARVELLPPPAEPPHCPS